MNQDELNKRAEELIDRVRESIGINKETFDGYIIWRKRIYRCAILAQQMVVEEKEDKLEFAVAWCGSDVRIKECRKELIEAQSLLTILKDKL